MSFFQFLNTYGLPLEVVLDIFKREDIVPNWTGFFRDSVESGRAPDRVQIQLEEAVGDVYGQEYRKQFIYMLTNWRRLMFDKKEDK